MAIVSAAELTKQAELLYAGSEYFYAILLNLQSVPTVSTELKDVVLEELSESIGNYSRQEFFYTNADINAYSSGVSVDSKRVTFTYGGSTTSLWTVNYIGIIKAPSVLSSTNTKRILSTFDMSGTGVDILNNRITVSNYANFTDGDQVILTPSTGQSLPAGLAESTIYYVKTAGSSQVELYSDSALTTVIDITNVSTGTGTIYNVNGRLFGLHALSSAIQAGPGQSLIYDIAINQGV
jgi:hypothetical protein